MRAIEMRVLLVGISGTEPAFVAWRLMLRRAGIPHDAVALRRRALPRAISRGDWRASSPVPYQALIFASDRVLPALTRSERSALAELGQDADVRRLIILGRTIDAGPPGQMWQASPEIELLRTFLTPSGRRVFPYLRGEVLVAIRPDENRHIPEVVGSSRILLSDADSRPLIYIRHSDGGEEMVQAIPATDGDAHTQLLRHGQLRWLTRGVYLGYERAYLSLQIDDVLHASFSWDVEQHTTDRRPAAWVRMSEADAERAARWSRSRGVRLDLAFNGDGSKQFERRAKLDRDPLLPALLADRGCFGWINHTYRHLDFDTASQSAIEADICGNLRFAQAAGIDAEPGALVTGGHTGLADLLSDPPREHNPALARALRASHIRYLGCDASRPYPGVDADRNGGAHLPPGTPFFLGPAISIPRLPTGLPFDATTPAQVLDRMRTTHPESAPASWDQLQRNEAARMFVAMLGNQPLPHYFHQSNLIGGSVDGEAGEPLLCTLIDEVLHLYRSAVAPNVPFLQPTMAQIGESLGRSMKWWNAVEAGLVRGYIEDSTVTVESAAAHPLDIPITGTAVGDRYAGTTSDWVAVERGETLRIDANAAGESSIAGGPPRGLHSWLRRTLQPAPRE